MRRCAQALHTWPKCAMVCPFRMIIATVSAFVAVFLVWHINRDSPQEPKRSGGDPPVAFKVRVRANNLLCNTWVGSGAHNVRNCRVTVGKTCRPCKIHGVGALCWICSLANFSGTFLQHIEINIKSQSTELQPEPCTLQLCHLPKLDAC